MKRKKTSLRVTSLFLAFLMIFSLISPNMIIFGEDFAEENQADFYEEDSEEELPQSFKEDIEDIVKDKEIDEELLNDEDKEVEEEQIEEENPPEDQELEENLDEIEDDEDSEEVDKTNAKGPLSLSKNINGVKISVKGAEGVIPFGSSLSIKEIPYNQARKIIDQNEKENDQKLEDFKLYDIKLIDKDGNEVQPNGSLEISFLGLGFSDKEEIDVFYLGDSLEESHQFEDMDAWKEDNEVKFTTDHLSIYAVATTPTIRYEFYDEGVLKETQIVKDGEFLLEPEVPSENFLGWYDEDDNKIVFGIPISVSTSETITINAKYKNIYYVYFIYDDVIVHTKEVDPGSTTNGNGVEFLITESGKVLKHWSTTEGGGEFDFNTPINEDTKLYAVLEDKWEVRFNSQGGSQVYPKYYDNNEALGLVETPIRVGYTFSEWNTQADGNGTPYNANTPITSNVDLYAIWQGNQVNYSLVYWQENADDTDYTYKETVTRTGTAGSTATVALNDRRNNRYQYFSYEEHDTSVVIKGDGSTIVNIYYSRNEYTVRFNLNRNNSTMTIGGTTYSNSNNASNQYSFAAKYNSDISHLWPTKDNVPDVGNYKFRGWSTSGTSTIYVSKRMNLTPELFNANGTTKVFTGSWITSGSNYKLRYMIETLNGSVGDGSGGEIKQYNGKWYQEDTSYSQDAFSSANASWNPKEIAGVTIVNTSAQVSGEYRYFYYTRNSYNLDFHNPDQIQSTSYLFGTDISDKNFTPTRPSGISVDYEFAGWYTTPDGLEGSMFNFTGKTMPEYNLSLYAKWLPPSHTVKYYKLPGGDIVEITNIPHGDTISADQLTERITPTGLSPEDHFLGWYWYPDGDPDGDTFVEFDFTLPIERDDIVLYPVWDSKDYTVTYDANGGTGAVPVDDKEYKLGAGASVLSPDNLTAPEDKVFIGWNTQADGNGTNYYPNNKIIIPGNITLYAQWEDKSKLTSIIYDGNGGETNANEDELEYNLLNNETHTVIANPFVREGYEFVEWNTKADGSGDNYNPGDFIVVDNSNPPNTLYAIWKIKTVSIKVTKTVTGNYGDKDEEFSFELSVDNGEPIEFELSHGQHYQEDDIEINSNVKLKEILAPNSGYEVTVEVNGTAINPDNNGVYDIGPLNPGLNEIKVTNHWDVEIDTGVSMDNLPYILLALVSFIGLAFVFTRKKLSNNGDL